MKIAEMIKKAFFYLTQDKIEWQNFDIVGLDEGYIQWYYMGDGQYVLRDLWYYAYYPERVTAERLDRFAFVCGSTPNEAYENYAGRWLTGENPYGVHPETNFCSKCHWAWSKKEDLGYFKRCPGCGRPMIRPKFN